MGSHFLPRGSSQPMNRTCVSCLALKFFTTEPPGKTYWEQRTILSCSFHFFAIIECISFKDDCWFDFREGNGTPLQYSCLENTMDGGAWWAADHGVTKSQTQLSDFTFSFHFHPSEKVMATHSSVLAWRIPGTEEPGGLQSMASLWVEHDWATLLSLFTFMHWRGKWQSPPVFLPGESQGRGSLVGWTAVYGVAQSWTWLMQFSSSSSRSDISWKKFIISKKA